MTDMINNPPHYKDESGIECIEITRHMGFCGGNCFKYLYRAGRKTECPLTDLNKALYYAKQCRDREEPATKRVELSIKEIARGRQVYVSNAMIRMARGEWDKVAKNIHDEIGLATIKKGSSQKWAL